MSEKSMGPQPESNAEELTPEFIEKAEKVQHFAEMRLNKYITDNPDASEEKRKSMLQGYETKEAINHNLDLATFKKYKKSQKLVENAKDEKPKEEEHQPKNEDIEIKDIENPLLPLNVGDRVKYQNKECSIYSFEYSFMHGENKVVYVLVDDKGSLADEFEREEKLNIPEPKFQIGQKVEFTDNGSSFIIEDISYSSDGEASAIESGYIDIKRKHTPGYRYRITSKLGSDEVPESKLKLIQKNNFNKGDLITFNGEQREIIGNFYKHGNKYLLKSRPEDKETTIVEEGILIEQNKDQVSKKENDTQIEREDIQKETESKGTMDLNNEENRDIPLEIGDKVQYKDKEWNIVSFDCYPRFEKTTYKFESDDHNLAFFFGRQEKKELKPQKYQVGEIIDFKDRKGEITGYYYHVDEKGGKYVYEFENIDKSSMLRDWPAGEDDLNKLKDSENPKEENTEEEVRQQENKEDLEAQPGDIVEIKGRKGLWKYRELDKVYARLDSVAKEVEHDTKKPILLEENALPQNLVMKYSAEEWNNKTEEEKSKIFADYESYGENLKNHSEESIPVIDQEEPKEPTDEEIENAIKLTEQIERENSEAKAKERFEALNRYLLESEENIEKDIEGRGRLNKILQTYKRNSGTRMVLGGALAVISAINPGAEAYQAFRVLFSGLGGYIAGENYAIGKTEKAALNLLPKDENGEVDLEKIKELDKDTLKEVYAALEQTASVKGLKINRELYKDDLKDHEERMNKKSLFGLNKKFNNLKEKYANLSAKKKIGLAVLTLGLGVATVPTLAMAGVGTSVGIGVSSGIQLFMGMLRTDIERNGQAYKHSEIIEEIRTILANNQDFEAKDIYDIYERRKEIDKGRKKLAIGGGALMATVSGVIMGWKLHQEQTKIEHTKVEGGNQPSVKGVIPISENQARLSPEEHLKEVQAGSTNLKAELDGMKPESLKVPGTSEHLAKAVVSGLEGKGQLPKMSEMDKENLIRQINAKWEHDGIAGNDGSIENFELLKQTSPIGTVHDVLGNMNVHGNNYYTDLLHVAPENIQNTNGVGTAMSESQVIPSVARPQIPNPMENYSTSGGGKIENLINNRPTAASGIEIRNPFSSTLDRIFDRTAPSNNYAWDHAKVMNKEQLASFLNPNNKNIIPEFSKQIDELVKNGMKPENVRISEDGKHLVLNLQGISSDPDRQVVVHQLVSKKSLLDPLLGLFHRTRPEELERYTGSKAFLGAENQINTQPGIPVPGGDHITINQPPIESQHHLTGTVIQEPDQSSTNPDNSITVDSVSGVGNSSGESLLRGVNNFTPGAGPEEWNGHLSPETMQNIESRIADTIKNNPGLTGSEARFRLVREATKAAIEAAKNSSK